ncbi:MAG TPA: hypothetical protein VL992_12660, partial [Tepidisphaeraceae bacterium]|nr:hypothetical protein [Tepidisphaeraceae bacterium]
MPIDYSSARTLLEEMLRNASSEFLAGSPVPAIPNKVAEHSGKVFQSKTQAYREVLLGCTVAKIQDPTIDPR